ncbi:MAG TPA: S49 family peptidase, partial [Candidatus Eremiobacteraceae bacterium]|nr:S49 family peptidase [Candidatus Eremiobacteraceae bacterium]
FYITPSGEAGSIGVYAMHQDLSKALEDAGVKTTFISAGKFKTEGNPRQPLAPEAQAFMQTRIDDYYSAFTKAVARGRNAPIARVRDGMGQGRSLGASAAVAAGMVDGVRTFDQTIQAVMRPRSQPLATLGQRRVASLRRELDLAACTLPADLR